MKREQRSTELRVVSTIGALLIAGLAMGCGGSSSGESTGLTSPLSTSVAGGDVLVTDPPSIGELTDALELTTDQETKMEAALVDWQTKREARHEQMSRNRDGRRGPGQRGPGQRGGRGRGHRPGLDAGERPAQAFLVACSDFLEPEQFASLCTLLAEKREAWSEKMHKNRQGWRGQFGKGEFGGHGGRRGQHFDGFADELNLTNEQQDAIAKVFETTHESARALHEQFRDGSIDEETLWETMTEMRESTHAQLEGILTDAQLAQWEDLRDQRRSERLGDREERFAERLAARIEFLTDVLDLSDAQKQQIADITQATHDQITALLADIDRDNPPTESMRDQMKQLRDDAQAQLRELLNDDQAVMFDGLIELRPEHAGPPMGHGAGRGRGMRFPH